MGDFLIASRDMVTRAEAFAIAQARLVAWKFDGKGDVLILIENKTIERPYAWVVFRTSKRWYETGELRYAMAEAGPFIIAKQTGSVTQYSSAYGYESALKKYEEEQKPYRLRITADLIEMRTKLLVKRLLPISNQDLLHLVREPATLVAQGAEERLQKLQQEWSAQGLASELITCF
ncbi:MAG: hypothetical protein EOO60_11235 [Hymenobacter sp.]|nr:MAG: hypothetical protein EOO60_11235 [Hymenobacter sp.]